MEARDLSPVRLDVTRIWRAPQATVTPEIGGRNTFRSGLRAQTRARERGAKSSALWWVRPVRLGCRWEQQQKAGLEAPRV
eukprot:6203270-Pleurochrysis_carterae.AAC.1